MLENGQDIRIMDNPLKVIRRIQVDYFKLLKGHFPEERYQVQEGIKSIDELVSEKIEAEKRGIVVATPAYVPISSFEHHLNQLFKEIWDFWQVNGEEIRSAIREMDYISLWKALGSFDIEPTIRKFSLYFDTICIQDPLQYDFRVEEYHREIGDYQSVYKKTTMFAGYLLLTKLEDLFLADCVPPICVIYPSCLFSNYNFNDASDQKYALDMTKRFLASLADIDSEGKTLEEVVMKLKEMPDEKVAGLAKGSPALTDLWSPPPSGKIMNIFHRYWPSLEPHQVLSWKDRLTTRLGVHVLWRNLSFFFNCEYESRELLSDICINPSEWGLYKWKLGIEQSIAAKEFEIDEGQALTNIFQQDNLNWLGNVSLGDIIRLREHDQLEEMRSLFRINRKRLKQAKVDEYPSVARQVEKDLLEAISDHSSELKRRHKELRKRFSLSLGKFGLATGFGVASAMFPWISPLAIGSLATSITIGGLSIKDMIDSALNGKRDLRELANRPVAVLLKSREEGEA